MERRPCGNSGLEISVYGVGAWSFGGQEGDYWGAQEQAEVERVVHAALDMGVNYFDTAELYNNGRSEESLGKALGDRRDEAVIGTKIRPEYCTPKGIQEHCHASLRRLNTDVIDIYMVHWPIQEHPVDAAFETLMGLQDEGKIRTIGVSNFTGRHLREALTTGAEIAVNQLHYSLFSRAIEYEALPACIEHSVGVVAYMPLLQGILTGKYRTLDEVPWYRMRTRHFRGDRRGARHGGPGAEEELMSALEAIRRIADDVGAPMSDVALAWVAAQPGVTCVLAGARDVNQLRANVRGCTFKLSPDTITRLSSLTEPIKEKLGPDIDYWESPDNSRAR